jgi:hypothetical protein
MYYLCVYHIISSINLIFLTYRLIDPISSDPVQFGPIHIPIPSRRIHPSFSPPADDVDREWPGWCAASSTVAEGGLVRRETLRVRA